MTAIIKNDVYRLLSRRYYILISLLMIMISVFLAVYISSKAEIKGNIALITHSQSAALESKYFKVTTLKKAPPRSELVLDAYDAVIIDKGSGNYDIETIKGNDFKNMLAAALKDPASFKPQTGSTRGPGENILGYLLMFLMMQGVLFMFTYAEDKEQGQIERIAASPVSFVKYLFSHSLFTFLFLMIPSFVVIVFAKEVLGFAVGLSILQYFFMLAVICALSTAFALMINSLMNGADNANMTGSSLVVLTSVLAGSFYSFGGGRKFFDALLNILPQKDYLALIQGIEKGDRLSKIMPYLIYVLLLTLIFFIVSVIKNKKDYIGRRD